MAPRMEFNRGKPQNRVIDRGRRRRRGQPARVIGDTTKRGTEDFLADEEIFGTVEYHYDILAKRLRELSFLNNGVKIRLIDQRTGKEEDFAFAGGVGLRRVHQPRQDGAAPNVFTPAAPAPPATAINDADRVEVAMQWNDSYQEQVLCVYTNNIPQADGGTHLTGLRAAMTASSTSTSKKTRSPRRPRSTSPATTCAKASPACCRSRCPTPSSPARPR